MPVLPLADVAPLLPPRGTLIGLDGLMFCTAPDKTYAVQHVQAYNDYHWHEWCEAHPGRFIMNGILPAWDIDATVAEVKRLVKGRARVLSKLEKPSAITHLDEIVALHDRPVARHERVHRDEPLASGLPGLQRVEAHRAAAD